jgi:hypothetical protein
MEHSNVGQHGFGSGPGVPRQHGSGKETHAWHGKRQHWTRSTNGKKPFCSGCLLEQLEEVGAGSPLRALAGGPRNGPPRQRTLRDSIAWSYHLLDAEEQRLFARLAVFRGDRSLEAIEGICREGLSMDVLDGLASLLDKNLVQQKAAPNGELRFVMLEMLQEYARE